jgi:transporter family protein
MKGEILALSAAILWGIAPIFDKLAIAGNVPLPLANLIRSSGGLLFLLVIVLLLRDFDFSAFDAKRISFLMIAGSIAGGIAMIIFYFALRQIGASKTVPLSSIYPLFTVMFSALFLGESVSWKIIAGTVLIVAGVILVSEG